MSELRLVLTQTGYQLVSVARNRRAVVFSLVFPIVLLVMFNSVFVKSTDTVDLNGVTIDAHTYFTGSMLAYAILLAGFNSLAISLVMQRESGQLKRLRGTPVPSWTFMVATVLRCVVTVGLMTVVLLAIGHFAYDVQISASAVGDLLLYVVLGIAAMCSAGIAATALIGDVDSASAALPLIAVVLSLISGIFVGDRPAAHLARRRRAGLSRLPPHHRPSERRSADALARRRERGRARAVGSGRDRRRGPPLPLGAPGGAGMTSDHPQPNCKSRGSGNAGLATAFGHTFWWAVDFTALALVPALFLPARRPVGPAEETQPAGVKPQAA